MRLTNQGQTLEQECLESKLSTALEDADEGETSSPGRLQRSPRQEQTAMRSHPAGSLCALRSFPSLPLNLHLARDQPQLRAFRRTSALAGTQFALAYEAKERTEAKMNDFAPRLSGGFALG